MYKRGERCLFPLATEINLPQQRVGTQEGKVPKVLKFHMFLSELAAHIKHWDTTTL